MNIKTQSLSAIMFLALATSTTFVPHLYAEDDLTQLLDEMTELATKTRLNVDYVPGSMSIIRGEELKSLGITNLSQFNAFDFILGMETQGTSLRGTGVQLGGWGKKLNGF